MCVCVCVCVCGGERGASRTKSRGRPSPNLPRIRFLESVHREALCSVIDPWLHRATRRHVVRAQILVRCLANSKRGKNQLCCTCSVFQPHQLTWVPHVHHLPDGCRSAGLEYLSPPLCLPCSSSSRLYTHVPSPEGVSFFSFLLPTVSLVEILHLPPSLSYSACLSYSPHSLDCGCLYLTVETSF